MSVNGAINRRLFLKILGGSLAAAGISTTGLGICLGSRKENGVRVIELVKELVNKYRTTYDTEGFKHVAAATLAQMLGMCEMVYIKHGMAAAVGVVGCCVTGITREHNAGLTALVRTARAGRLGNKYDQFLGALNTHLAENEKEPDFGDIDPKYHGHLDSGRPAWHVFNHILVADWMGYDRQEELRHAYGPDARVTYDDFVTKCGVPPFNDPNETFTEDDDLSWLDDIEV